MSWGKLLSAIVVIGVGGTLLGQSQLAGSVAVLVGVLGLMTMVITGGRPRRRGGTARARSPRFLSRYHPPTPRSAPAIVLAGLAAGRIVDQWGPAPVVAAILVVVLGFGFGILDTPARGGSTGPQVRVVSSVLGAGGTIATIVTAFADPACRPRGATGLGAFVLTIAAALGSFAVTRLVAAPVRRRHGAGDHLLLLFGLVGLAFFVAVPQGLPVWDEAPAFAEPLALVLVVVIAGFAAFNGEFIEAMVSVALLGASVALVAAEHSGRFPAPCGEPVWSLAMAVLFAVVAVGASGLKPANR